MNNEMKDSYQVFVCLRLVDCGPDRVTDHHQGLSEQVSDCPIRAVISLFDKLNTFIDQALATWQLPWYEPRESLTYICDKNDP